MALKEIIWHEGPWDLANEEIVKGHLEKWLGLKGVKMAERRQIDFLFHKNHIIQTVVEVKVSRSIRFSSFKNRGHVMVGLSKYSALISNFALIPEKLIVFGFGCGGLYFFNTINNEGVLPAIYRNDGDRKPRVDPLSFDDEKYFDPVLRIPLKNLEKFSQHPGRWYKEDDYLYMEVNGSKKYYGLKNGVDIYA